MGVSEQIDKFGDRPGGMTDGEEGIRGSSGNNVLGAASSEDLWFKTPISSWASSGLPW
jgi:hypothetical protein